MYQTFQIIEKSTIQLSLFLFNAVAIIPTAPIIATPTVPNTLAPLTIGRAHHA